MRDQKNALDRKVKRAAWAASRWLTARPRPRRLTARENKKIKNLPGRPDRFLTAHTRRIRLYV